MLAVCFAVKERLKCLSDFLSWYGEMFSRPRAVFSQMLHSLADCIAPALKQSANQSTPPPAPGKPEAAATAGAQPELGKTTPPAPSPLATESLPARPSVMNQPTVTHPKQESPRIEQHRRAQDENLDIEAGLRSLLEFAMVAAGPANFNVFLPSSSGDYCLGAYVGDEAWRIASEELAHSVPGAVEKTFKSKDTRLNKGFCLTPNRYDSFFGRDVPYLSDHLALWALGEEGEILCVVMATRSQRSFAEDHVREIDEFGLDFARKLARTIRVHHRHVIAQLPEGDE